MKTIQDHFKPGSFMHRCMEGLKKTGEVGNPVFCVFCGKENYEFVDPRKEHPRVVILKCDCEKYYNELKDEFNSWRGRQVPAMILDYVSSRKNEFDRLGELKNRRAWENKQVVEQKT